MHSSAARNWHSCNSYSHSMANLQYSQHIYGKLCFAHALTLTLHATTDLWNFWTCTKDAGCT